MGLISIGSLSFLEEEKITSTTLLTCHPQNVRLEAIGVPVRVTVGYQCFYDVKFRTFQGMTFYAPSSGPLGSAPRDMFKYVLACMDGELKVVGKSLCLIGGGKTIMYDHLQMTKTSGKVKKGTIIGNVQSIPNGYGYGVSIRGYKGGAIWNIVNEIFNIPCVE